MDEGAGEGEDNEMAQEGEDDEEQPVQKKGKKKAGRKNKKERHRRTEAAHGATQKDYDLFLQDLEEDPELRQ